uniref:Uncharacterized protein n=1 Tax=Anopheles atroparvus TaxID=41427 RepID=A0A182IN00_ANOAO
MNWGPQRRKFQNVRAKVDSHWTFDVNKDDGACDMMRYLPENPGRTPAKESFPRSHHLANNNQPEATVEFASGMSALLGQSSAIAIEIHQLYLMFPVAMVCSFLFHLRDGTPPNAIVAGVGDIRIKDMAVNREPALRQIHAVRD